jgi:hypothetical protein
MPGKCHTKGTSAGPLSQLTDYNDRKEKGKRVLRSISLLGMIALALLFSFVVPLPVRGQQQPTGAARIVVNDVSGRMPTARERVVMRVGVDVFPNEVIDTLANSAALLVFQDDTQLGICPSTQVTLRGVVFDPNPTKSQLIVSIPNGCTRLSTGRLLKTAFFDTPSAEIRTYGTILTVTVSGRGGTTVSVAEGTASVTGAGRVVTVAAGQSTLVLPGQPPSPPVPTPPEPPIVTEMDRLLAAASVRDFGTRAAARSPAVEAPTDAGTRTFTPNVDGKIQSEIAECGGTSRGTHGACGSRGTH